MIVRCNNCVSAFAVDDEKIADKKFAFKCPKCGSENIIDNRIRSNKAEKKIQLQEPSFNDDFSIESEFPADEKIQSKAPEAETDDLFFEEPLDKTAEKTGSLEDEIASEFPENEIPVEEPVKKDRKLNLEIEEAADFSDLEMDDIFAEEPAPAKKEKHEDIPDDIPAFDTDEDFIAFEDEKKPAVSADEFDIELKDDTAKAEEEDILFDDFEETPEKPGKEMAESGEPDSEREKKLNSQDDIDALFAEEGIVFDEKPISKQAEIDFEDEITVDLDSLDIELEGAAEPAPEAEISGKTEQRKPVDISDDDITLDIDNLDIDLEETPLESDIFEEPVKSSKKKQVTEEDDITLDIDNLDIDLIETPLVSDLIEEPAVSPKNKKAPDDEDITLDIDNLDIDLDETPLETDIFKEPAPAKASKKVAIQAEDESEFNEEDIKLNLDDLDIDLEEIEERELIFEDDIIDQPVKSSPKKPQIIPDEDEDESITIDLDTLELEIAEEKGSLPAELSEEDEKLTLDDAGLTFDELTTEKRKHVIEEPDEEDIKLTLDDIDPELTLDRITKSAVTEKHLVSETLDELPEIDLDEYDAIVNEKETSAPAGPIDNFDDEFVVFPEPETVPSQKFRPEMHDEDMFDYRESDHEKTSPQKGNTFLSIDFSLRYSRIGALLRLLGLYLISMIPHFIVMFIYTLLSSILGFINQIVILSTGQCVVDFAQIIENTMRYFFYMKTNIIGIVEDRPVYAGKEYLDHPLQLSITYPLKYSKIFAVLRLSMIGIMLVTVPHLLILTLITLTVPVVYFIGIIAVIITGRWPNLLFIYLTKYFRYLARISSFMLGLTDEYPPFTFD